MTKTGLVCPTVLRLAFATSAWLVSPIAMAQTYDSAVRIDQLQPASAGSPFLRAEGPRDRFDHGVGYSARVIAEYLRSPLRAAVTGGSNEVKPVSLVEHAALVHAGGQFSPTHWLNLELDVPFAVFERGAPAELVNGEPLPAGQTGLGDVRFGAHVLPVNTDTLDVQVGARFWAPTGSEAAYLQGPKRMHRVEAVLAAAGKKDSLLYGCTLGLAPMWFAGRDGDRLALSCAGVMRFGSVAQLGFEPHFAAFTYRSLPEQEALAGLGDSRIAVSFEPMGSVGLHAGDVFIQFAGGAGLGDAPGTASARGMLSLTYAAVAKHEPTNADGPDRDLDGLPDRYDACPDEAGTEERRGCPDKMDRDGDGIMEDDACPNEPGARYDDDRANGCPDRDNDHIADPVDECATEPGEAPTGCPKYARLEGKKFVVMPPLAFATRNERLSSTQTAALVEIVRTIRANPDLGHVAIKLGTKGGTNQLADKRAAQLLAVLNEQNLESTRYELVLDDKTSDGVIKVLVTD